MFSGAEGWVIVRELTLLAACAAPALYVGQAAAAGSRLVAAYAFTWAGIEVGELETEIVEAEGTYRVTWSGRTTGVVGLMFPFESHGSAAGQRAGRNSGPRSTPVQASGAMAAVPGR